MLFTYFSYVLSARVELPTVFRLMQGNPKRSWILDCTLFFQVLHSGFLVNETWIPEFWISGLQSPGFLILQANISLAYAMLSDTLDGAKIFEPGFLVSQIRITFHGVTSSSGLKLVARLQGRKSRRSPKNCVFVWHFQISFILVILFSSRQKGQGYEFCCFFPSLYLRTSENNLL